jgi:DNA-binding response OmpR family regulator
VSSKILVVDHEAKLVKLVRSYLEQSGFTVVEARDGQTALIQARREKPDLVVLDLGADDYVTKPFNPRGLVSRVRAVLRRTGGTPAPVEMLRAGPLVVDTGGHAATLEGRPLDLTPTEFDLLAVLLPSPGRAFTRLELLDRVQGDAFEGYERTIDAHIKNLRAKLGDDPRHPRYIQTVFGVGYKLGAEV